jgi:uncharacterized alpha-E superfamily protein
MLSRVADALYWMGRYLERAENVTRLLLVTEDLTAEIRGLHEELAERHWQDLLAFFPGAVVDGAAARHPGAAASLGYLHAFLVDEANPYSVAFSLGRARDNARSVREAITLEVFLMLNETYRDLESRSRAALRDLPGVRSALTATHKGLLSIAGAIDSTLTRDHGWRFLKLGEGLERTFRTALVLRAALPSLPERDPHVDPELTYTRWRSLLRGVSSLENFRQAHGARLEPRDVIRFLLFDGQAPRSIRHGVAAVQACLGAVAQTPEPGAAARAIGKLSARLTYEADEVIRRAALGRFLDDVIDGLGKAHDALAGEYFTT